MTSRRATIADVAREAGVAASTASVVFSGKAPTSDATRARVLAAAARVGYTGPDPRAASLRRGSSGIVGVVVQGPLRTVFRDPVTRIMMDGIADGIATLGAGILLLRDDDERALTLTGAPLDAAVLVGCNPRMHESLQILRGRRVPVVVIEGDAGADIPKVTLDNRDAQRELAQHVRSLGHTDVVAVTLPASAGSRAGWLRADDEITVDVTTDRWAGVRDVFPDASAFAAATSSIDEGLAAGRILLADAHRRPTAVIAQSDLLAAGVIRAAEQLGLRVPEDLTVTGFDGVVVDGLTGHELTTMVQPAAEKGRAAGHVVTDMLGGRDGASFHFTCSFRAGDTAAPVRP